MSIFHDRFSITLIALALSCLAGCSGCPKEAVDVADQTVQDDGDPSGDPVSDSAASAAANEDQAIPSDEVPKTVEDTEEQSARTASARVPKPAQATTSDAASEGEEISTADSGSRLTAEETRRQAEKLYRRAQSQSGNAGQAFQDASRAWELLNKFPDNAECRALAAEIADQLEGMANKANESYRGDLSDDRMLIEK